MKELAQLPTTRKPTIVGILGERELLLPELVHEALSANTRAKYFFTLLQLAQAHADAVEAPIVDLHGERERAGIADEWLDGVIAASRQGRDSEYRVPGARSIVERLFADIDTMIAPLRAAAPVRFEVETVGDLERRRAQLSAVCLPRSEGAIDGDALAALASSDRARRDSAHLLVLDLHKAVDRIAASIATDDVDGAKVYALDAPDRELVAAFMRGIHSTEALKFTHPGLSTIATRAGDVLTLENDIGETSAHVLVVRVHELRLTVTSTDVHLPRLEFFRQMLDGYRIEWADVRSRATRELADVGMFYECVGTLDGRDRAELERFLTHLGSRLVFLIDWNRARKVLRAFVPKAASLELLTWAATEGIGHRGFLEMGADRLVYDALAAVVRTPIRFGERLDDVLGEARATELLRFVLRTCSVGLREHRSPSLMRAEIRACLSTLVRAGGERLLSPIADHASLVNELAVALRAELRTSDVAPHPALEEQAKTLEQRGDGAVILLRTLARRMAEAEPYLRVIEVADDAADALEEVTFMVSLLPPEAPSDLRQRLGELGDLVETTTKAYVACVTSARGAEGEGLHRVLDTFDEISALERKMDDSERAFISSLGKDTRVDGKLFVIASRVAAELERAVDAVTHAALLLRDCVSFAR